MTRATCWMLGGILAIVVIAVTLNGIAALAAVLVSGVLIERLEKR